MILDLTKNLLKLDGAEELREDTRQPIPLSGIVAQILAGSGIPDARQYLKLAKEIFEKGKVELTQDQLHNIEIMVQSDLRLPVIARVQILDEIEKVKELIIHG